jgi:hypothetical protein
MLMLHHDQTVSEMATEILEREATTHAQQTGESFEEALANVLKTEAGKRLQSLCTGPYRNERAAEWQESLAWERARERSEV